MKRIRLFWVLSATFLPIASFAHIAPRIAWVTSTYTPRSYLIELGRSTWRAGVPSVVLVGSGADTVDLGEYTGTEVWVSAPDGALPWNNPADGRSTSMIRVANETLQGRFDFLCFGDDDVVWLFDNVPALVKHHPPRAPAYFTDAIGAEAGRDAWTACARHWQRSPLGPGGCARTPPERVCLREAVLRNNTCLSERAVVSADGRVSPGGLAWGMGCSGGIASVGLVNSVSKEDFAACEHCNTSRFTCTGGGDVRIGLCFWNFGANGRGIAPTVPFPSELAYDAGIRLFGRRLEEVRAYAELVAAGAACDADCLFALTNVVSLQYDVKSRNRSIVESDIRAFHGVYSRAKQLIIANNSTARREGHLPGSKRAMRRPGK